MKTIRLIISVMSLVALLGCQAPKSTETEVSIMFDITGSSGNDKMDITTQDVYEIFDLADNPFNFGQFRASTLTETHLSKIYQTKLLPVVSIGDYNKFSRENHIRLFLKDIDSLLFTVKNAGNGKKASSLFIPISKELHRLANSKANKKVLLCFTDLFENSSSMFSVYPSNNLAIDMENLDKLTELLSKKAPIPDNLRNIEIYLIYNPDLNTDRSFLMLSQWYKALLESKGAIVHISANFILD